MTYQMREYSSVSIDTTLAAGGISSTASNMTVATGTGSPLLGGVTLTAGDTFAVAIDPDTINEEVVFITSQSGDTFDITRGCAGTSQVVHAAGAIVRHILSSDDLNWFNQTSPGTLSLAKGDIIVATGEQAVDRLPIGTDGKVLTADSTQTLGVKWEVAAAGYSAPTIGSTPIPSGATVTTIAGLTLTAPVINMAFNAQTGTTYTFVASDASKFITGSNSSATTMTVPPGVFSTGAVINVQQIGAGQITISPGVGVTITSTGAIVSSPKTRVQYAAASIICTNGATNTFTVVGDIA